MELYDDNSEQKKSKVPMIIGICIFILVLLTGLIIAGIIYLKNSIITITVDGISNPQIEELLHIETIEDKQYLCLPTIEIAQHLNYQGFTGDYKYKSEDKTKCYVEDINKNETAMFTKDSNVITKITSDSEIEYVTIDKPVLEKDGKLYTTIDGIQKAFNVSISCDKSFKNIDVYSMDYLIKYCANKLQIKQYSTNFADKKAIFQNMIIIQNNNQYGVINVSTGKTVLETKYQEIRYLPVTTDFIVKTNGKYGIVTKEAKEKVRTIYDDITIMDNQKGLYLVKQNNTYGVINTNGETVIEPEYKQIGINNVSRYTQNGVENSYVLLNEIIPIMNNQNLWAFFNTKGEKITEFKYTGIGCTSSNVSNSYPTLIIPSYKIIVVQIDKYYDLVTLDGKELIPENVLTSVYLKTNTETAENQYFMTNTNNEKVINVEEWLSNNV